MKPSTIKTISKPGATRVMPSTARWTTVSATVSGPRNSRLGSFRKKEL
jgi:hypothetical protein